MAELLTSDTEGLAAYPLAIAKIEGVHADDIDIITITDIAIYVDILNGKGPLVLKAMKNTTIKGKLLKVHEARQ